MGRGKGSGLFQELCKIPRTALCKLSFYNQTEA